MNITFDAYALRMYKIEGVWLMEFLVAPKLVPVLDGITLEHGSTAEIIPLGGILRQRWDDVFALPLGKDLSMVNVKHSRSLIGKLVTIKMENVHEPTG